MSSAGDKRRVPPPAERGGEVRLGVVAEPGGAGDGKLLLSFTVFPSCVGWWYFDILKYLIQVLSCFSVM